MKPARGRVFAQRVVNACEEAHSISHLARRLVEGELEIPCANPSQSDLNDDGYGDLCQPNDADDDGWSETPIDPQADPPEVLDNCSPGDPEALCVDSGCFNPFQENFVNPTTPLGDLCEDGDGDSIVDSLDNCADIPNPDQTDSNFDSFGDVCQPDDADGELQQIYKESAERAGRVYNVVKVQSLNPPALKAWIATYMELMFKPSPLSRAEREMIATVVSVANGCHY